MINSSTNQNISRTQCGHFEIFKSSLRIAKGRRIRNRISITKPPYHNIGILTIYFASMDIITEVLSDKWDFSSFFYTFGKKLLRQIKELSNEVGRLIGWMHFYIEKIFWRMFID